MNAAECDESTAQPIDYIEGLERSIRGAGISGRTRQMPNRDHKRKLKAADRRRQRRAVSSVDKAPPSPSQSVDVSGLIVLAILDYVESCGSEIRDATVVAAMRGCLNGVETGKQPLVRQLAEIAQRTDVDLRAFRNAMKQMLELARQYQDPKNSSAFIRYIGILAS